MRMKYNKKAFDSAVRYYQAKLKKYKKKTILVVMGIKNTRAYYSIAPLSRALHNLDADMHVVSVNKHSEA